jgi:hypothetical protein
VSDPAVSPTADKAAAKRRDASSRGGRANRLPEKDRKIRQELVLMKTICGTRATEIAKELQISLGTVKSDLMEARRADTIVAARDLLVGMIPKALAVLDHHLDEGDKDVALVVLEGLGVIGKHMQVSIMPPTQTGVDSYEVFRARIIRAKETGTTVPTEGGNQRAIIAGSVVDAEVETPGS